MARSTALSCREVVELVTEYLEGALAPDVRRRFEEHLAGCDGCTAYLEQMRETIRVVGALSEETLDPAAREELVRAFRHWRSAAPPGTS